MKPIKRPVQEDPGRRWYNIILKDLTLSDYKEVTEDGYLQSFRGLYKEFVKNNSRLDIVLYSIPVMIFGVFLKYKTVRFKNKFPEYIL